MAEKLTPPCEEFVPPPDNLYAAYCNRCSYSKKAHEMWDQWTADAEAKVEAEKEEGYVFDPEDFPNICDDCGHAEPDCTCK